MSEKLDNLTSTKVKAAFDQICAAIASLQHAKTTLANLHYQAKQVEDLQHILDHLGQFASPSDDAHEAVYAQLESAKQTLRDANSGRLWDGVKEDLSRAYKSTDEAWRTIKQ
jgi:thioredoxin-like negative regulator of GroEL